MYRNILVAVDDSEKSKLALNSAIHSAVVFNSKLTICHIKKNTIIYTPIDPTGMLSTTHIFKQDFSNYMDEELEKYKEMALNQGVKEVEIVQTYSSSPGLAIAEVIAPGYEVDLIVCGASNKSGFDRFLLGSVSFDIVKHAKCDVNIIRNHEK
ncbi:MULTISPECIES: universal stress protein [Turicibacter]|jgi:universal stress family protein|uniref:Universal stress protein n=2 Tax=Turicibacter sanguinis TaxID=154288 RepID=A0A173SW03_9FIRM|nr:MULTISPECIES: universal stress protein [Turicibacter]EFF64982.1 universal stress family protein [Turicibacter sanguinis PC909]EGC92302.1 universal stress family protein [Turicibacter sp. HGF1]MBP3903124.1 universal stress protein [Turicibacter sp.]MCU7192004.1 universal stress protein [Turicibacter sanguinis]MCU7197602.1 universal stress protein [Turicibacter sanguinis]